MSEYTIEELISVEMSRHLYDDEMGFVGVGTGGKAYIRACGIPAVAARLAQLSHAPDFMIMFGPIIDPLLDSDKIPETNFEYDLIHWPCRSQITVYDSHQVFKGGKMGIGFVSGVQIDRYGNVNIVSIGDYFKPKVRLPGPLAQPDHFAHARRVFAVMKHDRRTFVEHVDFISGCGHENRDGLPGGGTAWVFTELAVLDFNEKGLMRLHSVHPGVTVGDVVENTGFELDIPETVPETAPPSDEEIRLIRERIDPKRKWLNATITLEPATLLD
jgi:glutaconate CoA-transferase subunit B